MLNRKLIGLVAALALTHAVSAHASAPPSAHTIVCVDVTGDGLPDRIVFGTEASSVEVNHGRGTWMPVGQPLPAVDMNGLLASDLDGDGALDLYIVSPGANQAWIGRGDGRFHEATAALGLADTGYGVSAERIDLDGDAVDDLLLHNASGDVLFYASPSGGATFTRDPGTPEIPSDDGLSTSISSLVQTLFGGYTDPASMPDAVDVLLRIDEDGRPELRLVTGAGAAPAAEAYASSSVGGGLSLGAGVALGEPGVVTLPASILAELQSLFVDDDAGEVDAADVIDGSLLGADVSTGSGNVVHESGSLKVVGTDPPPPGPNPPARIFVAPMTDDPQLGGGEAELWLSENQDDTFGVVLRYDGGSDRFELVGQAGFAFGDPPHLSVDAVTGRTGILTTSPNASLGVKLISDTQTIIRGIDDTDATVFRVLEDGRTGVGTPSPNAALGVMEVPSTGMVFRAMDSSGATVASIDSGGYTTVSCLEITGGCDLVETFEADGDLEPGTVVCIDPANPAGVVASSVPYDSCVLGAVSGAGGVAPGIALSQRGVLEGDTLVAMTGRIYVKCSAEAGAIRPGDRLTTAALAGHAMRATDVARSTGAVIGKALSSLGDGTGLVLVLVDLQ